MNTVERDTEREYLEWKEKNGNFIRRYVSELFLENSDKIQAFINKTANSSTKKYLAAMPIDEWHKYLGKPVSDEVKYYVEALLPKVIEELIFSDKFRARSVPDYNVPRYRGYGPF